MPTISDRGLFKVSGLRRERFYAEVLSFGIAEYKVELEEKIRILEYLLQNFNDGRRKTFYCTAVNLMDLPSLNLIINQINEEIGTSSIPLKNQIDIIIHLFEAQAAAINVDLKLKKK